MMDENLFLYVEWFPVKHAASHATFLSEKMSFKKSKEKKKERKKSKERMNETVKTGWTDFSGSGLPSFLSKSSMQHSMLIQHNLIKPLNVRTTNSFS